MPYSGRIVCKMKIIRLFFEQIRGRRHLPYIS